jgi:hypothetical protein
LVELGLLDLEYKRIAKGQSPEFDERTGRIKATGYKVTSLGKLLIRSIEQPVGTTEQASGDGNQEINNE